ncbi:MAG: energy transducer TonB [Brevundimonas sp.]|uniref:energy transducer TonB n=1 Tax=Brevundimonas sp. TaxID=1871086 RepID=UPI0027456634|nr:energy transducer TonB [Brevundimonas sp.]MDP3400590.1 energy transducer TonB [Brevundimonas sp.]MDZ4111911.1 energy transducer TonB [Brevundimonas sp.]
MTVFRGLAAAALAIAMATPGLSRAQDAGDDWDLVQDPGRSLTMALLAYDSGPAVAVRCADGRLEVLVSGLPESSEQTVTLELGFGDEELRTTTWWRSEIPGIYASTRPGQIARRFRQGGALNIVVPGEEGEARRRFVMDLVPSASAINTVLTDCGQPIVDTRVPSDPWVIDYDQERLSWQRRPTPDFPALAVNRSSWGLVFLSCIIMPDGTVRQCQVDSEEPPNLGFGEEALASARTARGAPYTPTNAEQAEHGRLIHFTIAFRLQ